MKILLLASRIPYPLHNGEDLRIFHFAKHLSERHELHLVAYQSEDSDPAMGYFKNILTLKKRPQKETKSGPARILESFSLKGMYPFDSKYHALIQKVLREENIGLIWTPSCHLIPYINRIPNIPVFFDVMDDGVLECFRDLRHSPSLKDAAVNLKRLGMTYLFEKHYFKHIFCCCFVSERDAKIFNWVCPQATNVVIPNGVDGEYFSPQGLGEDFPSLVFEGNMGFPPSVDAVLYFCNEILPLIVRRVPKVKFYIVGKDPAPEVQALASNRIVVTGFVEDQRPYLDQASIFVCPMRKGAGIKNKILQAWAMAKPVVATTIAVGGLRTTNGENILIEDEPASFARQVEFLLNNPELRGRLGQKGRDTVLQHHTWQQQVKLMEERLAEL
jgi:sugar transferase (PEP-CTERM/EpsH1 system associated)